VTDSASGGYLLPASSPAPLQGRALLRFLQQIVVGVTGLDGKYVRPRWQEEPPDIPTDGVAWADLRVSSRPTDEFPYVGRVTPDDGADHLQRHETLDMLVTFYDTGSTGLSDSGGTADNYAAMLRDGLAIEQNRSALFLAGMGVARIGTLVTVPVLFKQRWQYRVDFDFAVRRQIDRSYPVRTLVSASGVVYYDNGLPPQPFNN